MTTEIALIDGIRKSDVHCLAEWIELQRIPLMSIIQRKLGPGLRTKIEPEDIFQEVCTSATQSLKDVDLSERDPFPWLCQLIDRRIVDLHRRFHAQKRAVQQEIPISGGDGSQGGIINLLVASVTSPSMAFSRQQREGRLWTAIRTLPEDQQQVLTMRYVQNLPSKEIAEKLGKSDGAIRVMLTRAIKKLEREMSSLE